MISLNLTIIPVRENSEVVIIYPDEGKEPCKTVARDGLPSGFIKHGVLENTRMIGMIYLWKMVIFHCHLRLQEDSKIPLKKKNCSTIQFLGVPMTWPWLDLHPIFTQKKGIGDVLGRTDATFFPAGDVTTPFPSPHLCFSYGYGQCLPSLEMTNW